MTPLPGRLNVLHAIHDFLPRHRAGSEIYAFELGRALAARHHVQILCADYDPQRPHGQVTWRVHDGLPVIEVVNNWVCASFEDTYRSPAMSEQIGHVLQAIQPDIVHVHNLLNLSFELPAMARARGIPVVATLHDYTLVCPSGGQRIHRAERHLCDVIDPARCARCFPDSPFSSQAGFARVAGTTGMSPLVTKLASGVRRRFPLLTRGLASLFKRAAPFRVTEDAIGHRLAHARRVFDVFDLCVAPSQSIAAEFQRLGLPASKLRVSDYGFSPLGRSAAGAEARGQSPRALRIGYVGTLVWHKGVHVLLDAVRRLSAASYELKIFGDSTVFPDYAAALRAQAAGHPVRFMGPFDAASAGDVYDQIDVLVVPSLWLENSPLVIHEAFLARVPVVAARIGGIVDLVSHGRNGLLYDPPSADELAAALGGLIDHPDRLNEFRQVLPSVKTIVQDAQEWERTYQDLLRTRAQQPA